MSNLVIVAIPDENERVWKLSSEKVPHLTILFLGEVNQISNYNSIVEFVAHASTMLNRFHLTVDRRGELGDDKADVLFFKKDRYDYKAVRDFRAAVLQDNNVRKAYDAASQFEGPWTPHLTMGYPSAPAKQEDNDWGGIYSVGFNKIAVWTGDFEGPEFPIQEKWDQYDMMDTISMDVAMSDLDHSGVKGMKWGVRKEELPGGGNIRISERTGVAALSTSSQYLSIAGPLAFASPRFRREYKAAGAHNKQRRIDRKEARQDKKWEKKVYSTDSTVKVHNAMADHFNPRIASINDNPKYDKLDLINQGNNTLAKAYYKEVNDLTMAGYREGIKSVHGRSPSGKKQAVLAEDGVSVKIVDADKVKHAVEDDDEVEFILRRDDNDRILEMNRAETSSGSLAQTTDLGAQFLDHHGVKGMHWGVRREDVERAAESSTSKVGKAVRDVSRFTRDVDFESATRKPKDQYGVEGTSDAEAKLVDKAGDDYRKHDLKPLKDRHPNTNFLKRLARPVSKETRAYRKDARETYIKRLETTANSMTNASGTRQYTVRERGGELPTSQYYWEVTTRQVKHADGKEFTTVVQVLMDEEGYITGLKKSPKSMAQTADLGADFILEHHGVKGMKWGVRRAASNVANVGKKIGLTVGDTAYRISVHTPPVALAVVGKGRSKFMSQDRDRINAKYDRKGIRKKGWTKEKKRAYRDEVHQTMAKRMKEAAESLPSSVGGRRQVTVDLYGPNKSYAILTTRKTRVRHAEEDNEDITQSFIKYVYDEDGFIKDIVDEIPPDLETDSVAQTADLGAEFILEHYGVKGMHWGVRRGTPEAVTPSAMSRVPHGTRRKTKIKTEGGENHPAHQDAIKVAEARVKLKKSGTAALSNTELRDVANRIQLENQVKQLTASKGRQFVRGEIGSAGQGREFSPGRERSKRALKLVI